MFNCMIHTFVSKAHARLAANWLASLQAQGNDDQAVVHCADQTACDRLSKFLLVSDCAARVELAPPGTEVEGDWGSSAFASLMMRKLDLLENLSTYHTPWVYTDADTAFLRDPFEALGALQPFELDARSGVEREKLWFQNDLQTDHLQPSPINGGLCSGVIYCGRPGTTAVFRVARAQLAQLLADPSTYGDDQTAINLAHKFLCAPYGVLDAADWVNGSRQWIITDERSPILVHANWVVGVAGKEKRLRDNGAWFVREDHLFEAGLS